MVDLSLLLLDNLVLVVDHLVLSGKQGFLCALRLLPAAGEHARVLVGETVEVTGTRCLALSHARVFLKVRLLRL